MNFTCSELSIASSAIRDDERHHFRPLPPRVEEDVRCLVLTKELVGQGVEAARVERGLVLGLPNEEMPARFENDVDLGVGEVACESRRIIGGVVRADEIPESPEIPDLLA